MAPMPASRRLLRAGLVTLAAWLLLGGAIGVVSADDGEAESFVLPSAKLGDRVTYAQTEQDDGDQETSQLVASWDRREPLLLADGLWHEIDSLRYELGDLSDRDSTGTFDTLFAAGTREYEAGTHRMRAITVHGNGTGSDASGFVGPIRLQSSTLAAGVEMTLLLPEEFVMDVPDCFLGGLWGGQEIRSDGELRLPPCMASLPLGDLTLHGKGVEDVGGVPAIRFHGQSSGGSPWPAGGAYQFSSLLDVWLAPSSPYPLRVVASASIGGDWTKMTMELTGFQAGTQERATVAPWPADPAPELRFAPFQGLLPFDDADAALPFPLSRAVEASRSDPEVTAFLASHPKAYVAAAAFQEVATLGQPERTWLFTLADAGSQALDVTVTQSQPGGATMPDPFAPMLRVDRVVSVEQSEGNAPARSDLPALLPTMGSLLERWAWQRDVPNDGQACYYDLRVGGEDFTQIFAGGHMVIVGRTAGTVEPTVGPDGLALTETGAYDWAAYDMEGTAVFLMGVQANESTVYGGNGAAPPSSSGFAPLSTVSQSAGGWLPTPAQAAGAGLVAVLLGVLYWLWPKLKVLAFAGLFSRVAPARLLEHPGRARLLEIIQAEPGIHFQELVRRSGLATGTAVHHLNKLARGELIACRPLGRYTCYFPGSSPDRQSLLAAPLLRSEGARQVYEAILGTPDLSGLELAQRTGLQASTVNYHVQRLTEAGLVAARRDGRSVRIRAAAAATSA